MVLFSWKTLSASWCPAFKCLPEHSVSCPITTTADCDLSLV